MRRVVETSTVAHLWAHERQDEARNSGGNFYFEDKTIYSYGRHFPIAQHYRIAGEHIILFTTDTYSNTTAKHLGEVRGSIPHNVEVIHVPEVENVNIGSAGERDHRKNIKHLAEGLLNLMEKQKRARKYSYVRDMEQVIHNLNRYVDAFSCKTIAKKMTGKERVKNQPVIELAKVRDILAQILAGEDVLVEYKEIEKQLDEAQKERDAKELERSRKSIDKWKAGELSAGAISSIAWKMDGDLLRVVLTDNGVEVQTSKGVRLPYNDAKRAYLLVERVQKYQEEDVTFKHGELRVGTWSIDRITQDGNVRAGCHLLKWEEIKRVADQENWSNQ